MVTVDPHTILKTEGCKVTGDGRSEGDAIENAQDKLAIGREFDNCKNEVG